MRNEPYWAMVRKLVDSGQEQSIPKHDLTAEIVTNVYKADNDGEDWAAEVLDRWALAGASKDYTESYKDANHVTFIRADGRRQRKTVAYSRPMRDKADGTIVGRQMQAWWGMSRVAVAELRAEMAESAERQLDIIAMLDRIIAAMDRHPQCATAAEAWQADGRDLDEIDLAGVA